MIRSSVCLCVACFIFDGCVAASSGPVPMTEQQLAFNPNDREGNRPEILLTGAVTGRLMTDGKCVILKTAAGDVTPLWPEGTRLRSNGGVTSVVLPDGRGTAPIGAKVRLAGGAFPASQHEALSEFAKSACPDDYFTVSSIGR